MRNEDGIQRRSPALRSGRTMLAGAAVAACAALAGAGPAASAENGTSQYNGGASQFYGGAIPPISGLFALSQTNLYTASRLNDGNGDEIPIDFELQAIAEVVRFLYVSDIEVAGATLWGQVIIPIVNVDLEISPFLDEEDTALADVIFVAGLAWHVGHHTFVTGIDIATPTGAYDVDSPLNVGTNHWSIQPVLGYKYFDPKGFELSLSPRLIFNFENTATDYTNGTELFVDYAIGYNIGKFKVGAVGYLYEQLTDDEQFGAKVGPDGHRGSAFALGPSLTYAPHLGLQFSGSWQHEFYAENKPQGDSFWFNVATKF